MLRNYSPSLGDVSGFLPSFGFVHFGLLDGFFLALRLRFAHCLDCYEIQLSP